MTYLLIAVLSIVLVAIIAWPLVGGRVLPEPAPGAAELAGVEDDLIRSLDAIREIELDHRAGNLSDDDFAVLDHEERAHAVELMRRRDDLRGPDAG